MAEIRSLRDHGLRIGELEPGPSNSIADVGGVRVGHVTVVRDEPDPPAGRGVARSGVTAIVPRDPARLCAEPVVAGTAVLNGAGEMTGSLEIGEWGAFDTPSTSPRPCRWGGYTTVLWRPRWRPIPASAWTTW